jgi:hypothetical protein
MACGGSTHCLCVRCVALFASTSRQTPFAKLPLQVSVVTFSTFPKVIAALEAHGLPLTSACSTIVAAAKTSPLLRVSDDNM